MTGAVLYGRSDLSESELAPGVHREIRITHGGGLAVNHYTLRLAETDSGVSGELFPFWPTSGYHVVISGHSDCRKHVEAQDAWLAGLVAADERRLRGCGEIRQAGVHEVCRARFAKEPDWLALFQRLESLGAWTLPDPVTLKPAEHIVLHGVRIGVELRTGVTYRRYAYLSPHSQPGPEARQAAAINDLLLEVLNYRGAES